MAQVSSESINDCINKPLEHWLSRGEIMEILREVMMYRKATETPIGSFHIVDQDVEATTDYVKSGGWPIDNGELMLYALPFKSGE